MAVYKSRYSGLAFRTNGVRRKFVDGRYVTDDKNEIAVLDKLADAVRIDEPAPAPAVNKKAEETEPAAKSAPKKSGAAKSKTSDK